MKQGKENISVKDAAGCLIAVALLGASAGVFIGCMYGAAMLVVRIVEAIFHEAPNYHP